MPLYDHPAPVDNNMVNAPDRTRSSVGTATDMGLAIHTLAARLFPICRSITGNGVRDTLAILGQQMIYCDCGCLFAETLRVSRRKTITTRGSERVERRASRALMSVALPAARMHMLSTNFMHF